jgi:hypothetical protein
MGLNSKNIGIPAPKEKPLAKEQSEDLDRDTKSSNMTNLRDVDKG